MKTSYNLRSIAAKAIAQVLDQGLSLSSVIPELQKIFQIKTKRSCKSSALVPYVPCPS